MGKCIGTCTAVLVAWMCALTAFIVPAHALTYGGSPPWRICVSNTEAAEAVARNTPLEPANGATVSVGTPVTFAGESNHALTFSVASSSSLLSSPDLDSGVGLQSGAFYKFTSTKATATPGTIYWTASSTFTPGECESPSTFTTPVHTLVVAPTEAELTAAKRQQEEAAAKKKLEEEAAAARKEEEAAAAGNVVLDRSTIDVEYGREAAVELTCSDVAACAGKLTLTVSARTGKGKGRRPRTRSVGIANFSIAANAVAVAKIMLDSAGSALLGAAHGHLDATLTIARTSPPPNKTQSIHVRLEQRAAGAKK